jgi:signal transduction histidine kinase
MSQFDLFCGLSPQKGELLSAPQNHRRLVLRLTRYLEEAKKGLVPPDVGHQLVQIAREAAGNALRFAKAKSVRLTLEFTEVKYRTFDRG